MLQIKAKVTNLKKISDAISRAVPRMVKTKLTSIANDVEAQVQTGLYGLLLRDRYVSELLYGRLGHELGIPRGALEDVLWLYCKAISVDVKGTRNPVLTITLPSSNFLLTLEQSYYFGKDGKSWEWLSKVLDPTFNAVNGYWYRTSIDGKDLSIYSRSGKGVMLPAQSRSWIRQDDPSDRDFINNVLSSPDFLTFIHSIFKRHLWS